jgi:two-component system response regulator GlrR
MDLRAKREQPTPPTQAATLASGASARPCVDKSVAKPRGAPPARILVVEDQDDVRRMVATALEIEGYEVDEAANAQDGLRHLERLTYQLVLSDYAMPGGTGTWMLQEAGRRGLMGKTAAVIVTAHPDVRGFADVPVINKPLDLDGFLDQVRKLVDASPRAEPRAVHQKLELVLYISSRSASSLRARDTLERLLAPVDPAQVKCTIVDLAERPLDGAEDRIAFTPTLVRRRPGPRMWIVGSLGDAAVLEHLLRASGIKGL